LRIELPGAVGKRASIGHSGDSLRLKTFKTYWFTMSPQCLHLSVIVSFSI